MVDSEFKANDFFVDIASTGRWAIRYVLIGLIAGGASVLFYYLCQLGMSLFLDGLAGFRPPASAGEYPLFSAGSGEFSRWVLLILSEKIRIIEALNPKSSRHVLCFLETSTDPLTLCGGINSRSRVPVCEMFFSGHFSEAFQNYLSTEMGLLLFRGSIVFL
jgi:hypothetical protein